MLLRLCGNTNCSVARKARRLSAATSSGAACASERTAGSCCPACDEGSALPARRSWRRNRSWLRLCGMVACTVFGPSSASIRSVASMPPRTARQASASSAPRNTPITRPSNTISGRLGLSVFSGATGMSTMRTVPMLPTAIRRNCWAVLSSSVYSLVLTVTSRSSLTCSCSMRGSRLMRVSSAPISRSFSRTCCATACNTGCSSVKRPSSSARFCTSVLRRACAAASVSSAMRTSWVRSMVSWPLRKPL